MPAPTALQRDAFLDSLDAARRKTFRKLVESLQERDRTLSDCRNCGELLKVLQPAESGYGSRWLREICEALSRQGISCSVSLAYRFIKFADQFPGLKGKAQVEKLGDSVPWEAMLRIIHIEDVEKRAEILQSASKQKLSSRQVIACIREKTEYRRTRVGRRKEKPSTHPNRALKQLRVVASKWAELSEVWSGEGNNALKRTAKMAPAKLTDAFLDDLTTAVTLVEAMAKTAGPLAKELAGLHKMLNEKRNKQK